MAIDVNIPSQVKNYANLAAFPVTGTLKTIFIAEDTNKTYRWTGSVYVEISGVDLSSYVPTSRTLTINGTTQDLSANRTFTVSTGITIGTTAITSGTNGRFLFDDAGVVSETNGAFWDKVNGRFGLGTSSPAHPIDVRGLNEIIKVTATGGGSTIKYQNSFGSTWNVGSTGNDFYWLYNGVSSFMTLKNNGNVLINTTTDAGFKTDINGTLRAQGKLTVSAGGFELTGGQTNYGGYQGYGQMQLFSSAAFQMFNTANNSKASFQYTTATGLSLSINPENLSGVNTGLSLGASLVASANNQTLVAFEVAPAFTNSTFTGITQFFGRFANSGGGTSLPATTGTTQAGGILRLGRDNAILDIGSHSAGGAWIQSANRNNLATNYNLFLNPNGGNILIGTTVDAGFKLDVNGTARVSGILSLGADTARIDLWRSSGAFGGRIGTGYTNPSVNHVYITCDVNSRAIVIDDSNRTVFASSLGTSTVASAQVAVVSSTRGFLPPVMTNTQKNAIATPATGLMVYDTTLNKLCVRTASAWEIITSL